MIYNFGIMMCRIILLGLLLMNSIVFAQNQEKAIVKISVTRQQIDYNQPWQKSNQSRSSGSGVIIDGNRILTCAHVVEFGAFIEVKKSKDSKRYTASVQFLSPEYDLAVLTVDDDDFFKKTTPVFIGDLPDIGNKVNVLGFPTGGNDLSITSGIVSRIENIDYSYDNYTDLGIQIDAAINPGNSGGPVIMDTALVGIAFQGKTSSQNIGYMIPTTVIKSFLKDISDSVYSGPVPVSIKWQGMENASIRMCFAMSDTMTGVLVNDIHEGSALYGYIKPDDILLSVDGLPIQNDGGVYIDANVKTTFETIIKNKNQCDTAVLKILRTGSDTTMYVVLDYKPSNSLLVSKVDLKPKYYIQDGFVFTTPSFYYFQDDSYWQYYNPKLSYYYYAKILNNKDQRELVMISSVLPHRSNVGYHDLSNKIVTKINGMIIHDFNDLIKAFEWPSDYYTIEDEDRNRYIIDGTHLAQNNAEILSKYGIQAQGSY